MTTKEIPQHVIVESYLYVGTPSDVAAFLNQFYAGTGCRRITGKELQFRWDAEVKANTPLRELGPRPPGGFEQTDKVQLVKQLVAA